MAGERKTERTRGGGWRRTALVAGALAAAAWAVWDVPAAFGGRSTGARADRLARSPQFGGQRFRNAVNTRSIMPPGEPGQERHLLRELVLGRQRRHPGAAVPVLRPGPARPAPDGLAIIWYGHASTLVEIEGRRVLIDPVWSDRCSPSRLVGPHRMHRVPVPLDELPPIDAVLISHDHYDHLDMATIRALARTRTVPFLVPLGVGAHLARWGVPEDRIVELDWDETTRIGGLELTATAARHFSGRGLRRDRTLWASWVIAGAQRRVFYTGDSGYFAGYADIGTGYGPFDATLMQVGAYDRAWPDIHMFPEEAVTAHLELRGDLMIPVHWGTFNLALHDWDEPVNRVWREAKARGVRLAVPRPGERVDVAEPPAVDGWWQTVA
ncbi:MBL fold metallo-hydrolase [Plantactinospora sp. KBS50]|uniref:MBL fold metallo-hydrolase n=1 Tax=Plantactinospora sp. KBS50 TaxID=2024580 RepID=UPI000BAAC5A8|nr:MBL fold metallo-hydrolase [Plantactinospora sp. KBS50]ASW54514.1 Zn-dependent hydrolase [Plantactinospora sp. KBS50]